MIISRHLMLRAILLAALLGACSESGARRQDETAGPTGGIPDRLRMSVPEFIERNFGSRPGRVLQIAPDILGRSDQVELRLAAPPAPAQMELIATRILAHHGIRLREEGVMLLAELVDPGANRALPRPVPEPELIDEMPDAQVLVYRVLDVAGIERTAGWLAEEFALRGVETGEYPAGNALLLSGAAAAVEEALRFIDVLDQPLLRASHGRLLDLVHADAQALAGDLEKILQSEGVEARTNTVGSAVTLIALVGGRRIALFTTRPDLADHAQAWAELLDAEAGRSAAAVFSRALAHTPATRVVEILQGLAPPEATLVADATRNAVVFRGPPGQWRPLLQQIRAMDVPSATVMVELLVIEVSLGNRFSSGLEWLASRRIDGETLSAGSTGLLPGEGGFNLVLREGAMVRAALELFSGDSRVAIRARPRLVVASGHEARIEVGDEIPVVASTARSTVEADAPVVSNVEYRRTGLVLAVRPTVHATDRLDIDVFQDLSSARETPGSSIDSPTIQSRRLQTAVSLRDGAALLLGGLVASTRSVGVAGGMPLPAPFNAADARLRETARTELMVLIRPSVLSMPGEKFP